MKVPLTKTVFPWQSLAGGKLMISAWQGLRLQGPWGPPRWGFPGGGWPFSFRAQGGRAAAGVVGSSSK